MNLTPEQIERFWSKVRKSDGCWDWQGARGKNGYGYVKINGQVISTHRVTYELMHGTIANDMCVLHHCDNRACCRPDHLFLGTHQDNSDDKMRKGRYRNGRKYQGEEHYKSNLTTQQVKAIISRYAQGDISQKRLSEQYGVCKATISHILNGRNWKHITTD